MVSVTKPSSASGLKRPQRDPHRCPGAAAADPGETAPLAQPRLAERNGQADQHQHAREQRRRLIVELAGVLVEDRRGEGLDAQERQRAELRQHMRRDQQRAAAERRGDLRQHDAAEGPPAAMAERARNVLEARIEAAQCRDDRQIDQRHAVEGQDEDRALDLLEPRPERRPGEARDIGRHGERQCRREAPPARPRQIAALGAPRGRDGDDGGDQRDADRDGQRVEQEVQRIGAEEVVKDARRAGLPGPRRDVADRQDDETERDEARQHKPRGRQSLPPPKPLEPRDQIRPASRSSA